MDTGVLIALIILGVDVIFSAITAIYTTSRPGTVIFFLPNWAWCIAAGLLVAAGIFMFLPLGTI